MWLGDGRGRQEKVGTSNVVNGRGRREEMG